MRPDSWFEIAMYWTLRITLFSYAVVTSIVVTYAVIKRNTTEAIRSVVFFVFASALYVGLWLFAMFIYRH